MSSLVLMSALPERHGYIKVGTHSDGRIFVHLQPGLRTPEGAEEVFSEGQAWNWADLKTARPNNFERVLQASWDTGRTDADGRKIFKRGTMAEARAEGKLATATATDLPCHQWLGESK